MLLPSKDMAGNQTGEIEVSDIIFAAPVNVTLMHQALVRQLSNARLGTHKTKTRGEVAGGGRKPWKQKGTGRARQGSIRASQWVGGGTAFGPRPRKYIKDMPKKMYRAALRSALSVKAGGSQIVVLDEVSLDAPKTKAIVSMLQALGVNDARVLLVLGEKNENVQLSAKNVPTVKTLQSGYLNMKDLLGHDWLLLSRDAVAHLEEWLTADVNGSNGSDEEPAWNDEQLAVAAVSTPDLDAETSDVAEDEAGVGEVEE
jgi:large subunit ribosomal protein L4